MIYLGWRRPSRTIDRRLHERSTRRNPIAHHRISIFMMICKTFLRFGVGQWLINVSLDDGGSIKGAFHLAALDGQTLVRGAL